MHVSRRHFIAGSAAVGGAAASISATKGSPTNPSTAPQYSLYGEHQPGVVDKLQEHSEILAFDLHVSTKADLKTFFRALTDITRCVTFGGATHSNDLTGPPVDNGIVGSDVDPDGISVTVGVGASLFDARFGLSGRKPLHLHPMQAFANDSLDPKACHGDISVQVCAHNQDTVIHAVREICREIRPFASLRWRQAGFFSRPRPSGTPRNLLGFRDGIVQPSESDYNRIVWASSSEPAWAHGGTYQAVRLIRMFVEFWDRISVGEQEQIFGRVRETGAPLSGGGEFEPPNFDDDPNGDTTPLDSHIRLANPRTGDDYPGMVRRAFNYNNGVDVNGTLDMGLAFISYQQDLDKQFVATQLRLENEPLVDYIRPWGGGFFFILPGLRDSGDFYAAGLLSG